MFSTRRLLAIAAIAGLAGLCGPTTAAEQPDGDSGQSESNLGLNIFGFSLHTDRSAGYNEVNPGIGLRYVFARPTPRWAFFGDTSIYYDSERQWAKYVALGAYYRFAASWMAGAAVAYGQSRSYHEGTPFFAPVPGVAFEYRRIVFNAVVLPSETARSKIAGLAFFATIPLDRRD